MFTMGATRLKPDAPYGPQTFVAKHVVAKRTSPSSQLATDLPETIRLLDPNCTKLAALPVF